VIQHATIRGYRALLDVGLDLVPLTVLIGANASGKTTTLRALHDLMSLVGPFEPHNNRNGFLADLLPAEEIRARLSRCPGARPSFSVEALGDRRLGFEARAPALGRPDWDCSYTVTVDGVRFELPSDDLGAGLSGALTGLQPALLLSPEPDALVDPAVPMTAAPTVGPDGSGLGATLQFLLGQRDGRFDELEATVAAVIPQIKRLRAVPRPFRQSTRRRVRIEGFPDLWSDQPAEQHGVALQAEITGTGWIEAPHLSEGTLLVIALLTAAVESSDRLLLVDDLERGLHPTAQQAVIRQLRSILATRPRLQVVASTHSPYLLDELEASQVRVLALGPDGAARCKRLDEHPEWEAWRRYGTRPGEFWSDGGEAWVLSVAP
jgi:predicted ATPase